MPADISKRSTLALIALVVAASLTTGCVQSDKRNQEAKMPSNEVKGPAGSLYVDDGGTNNLPVVFVHSFAGDSAHWSAQLDHLRKVRRAVAFDMRGHGRSQAPAGSDYAVESSAGDIAAVVDQLQLKRFVLVGHSAGGAAALAYAGKHPQRVAGLVLVGAPGKVPAEEAQKIMAALESSYEKTMESYWNQLVTDARPQVLAKLADGRRKMPQDRSLAIIKAIFDYDPSGPLRTYRGPTLLVTTPGEDQPYALHRLAPHVPHRVIAGTSHWVHMDKPDEFNWMLDDFLRSVAAADDPSRAAIGTPSKGC
jgi:pimeloyl-ACP methyl ester carboxylesterase